MSNESLTCSNSSFIVDLPILTPSSSTLLVVETHTGGGVEIGKVSLPEALLRSGIPLTGTQIDTWVQSNSCNVAAATAWFLVNNVKTSRNNTWVANTSSYILSATNWVANNSARLNNLDFTIDGLTDNAIQAGTWFTENSTNLQSLSSDILSLSSDGASLQAFASWIVSNSSTLNNTVTSLTSLLVEEALEETFHNWVISNSSVFGTMLTTLRDLTGDESFIRNASQWVSSVSADVDQTVSWFKVLTSVRELHEVIEMSVFAWVTGNSAEISDILEKNSNGFLSWVSANSAEYQTVYNWYVDNEQSIQNSITWSQQASSRVDILEGSIAIALETAIDANTWISNNADTYASIESVADLATWITDNSSTLSDIQEWYGTLPATATAVQNAIEWIATNGDNVIEAAQWLETLTNSQLLNDVREDQVLTWVEDNSASLNTELTDPNATIALTWATGNSATILQAVNWIHLLTSTQEAYELNVEQVVSWVESTSDRVAETSNWVETASTTLDTLDLITPFIQSFKDSAEWYTVSGELINSAAAWVKSVTSSWVSQIHLDAVQSIFTPTKTWVAQNSSTFTGVANFTTSISAELNNTINWVEETSAVLLESITWIEDVSASVAQIDELVDTVNTFDNTNTWVQSNSSDLLAQSNADISLFDNVATYVTETSVAINAALDDVSLLNSTYEDFGTELTQLQLSVTSTAVSAVSALKWVRENQEAFSTITETANNLTSVINTLTPTTNWASGVSAGLAEITTWVRNNSSLAEVNNVLDNATTWVTQNSSEVERAVNWVSILTSTQQLHDNREEDVFAWVEGNSGALVDVDNTNLDWLNQNKNDIDTNITWVVDNSSKVQESHLATRAYNAQISNLTTWLTGNSAQLKDAAQWVNATSADIDVDTIQVAVNWVATNSSELPLRVEVLETAIDGLPEIQQWYSETDTQLLTDTANWVSTASGGVSALGTKVLTLSTLINTLSSVIDNSVSDVENITAWVSDNSTTITQTTEWVQMLTSTQQLYDEREDAVFTWVETHSGDNTLVDENLIAWVQNNSSELVDVKDWYNGKTFDDNKVSEAITWYQENSAKATEAVEWIEMLTVAQNVDDAEEEQVITWVQDNSSSIAEGTDSQADTWVQANSNTLEDVVNWNGFEVLNVDQVNAATTIVSETSALAEKTAQWVQALSSAQNLHDVEEDQVFAWVQSNSGSVSEGTDSQSDTWVRENSNNIENVVNWNGFEDLNVDQINAATTIVSETSALAEKTAQWVQALSSAQNLHDVEEDQVFAWVQSNSSNIQDVSDSTDAITWVQANSNTVEDIASWNGFEDLNVDQVNETITWYQENSAKATEAVQWIEMLTVAQNVDDAEEEQVITWVQENSSSILSITDTQPNTWVRENSNNIEDVVNWNGFEVLNVDQINEVSTIVSETSALAEKTAQWVQALSSAQNLHDLEEDQIFAWVQDNSGNEQAVLTSADVNTWVQGNSSKLSAVEAWYDENHPDTATLNSAVDWYSTYGAKAVQATEWVDMLAEANNLHDTREESVLAWVEAHSGDIAEGNNLDDNLVTWVQDHSASLNDLEEEWNVFTDIDIDQINAATTIVSETSALSLKTAQWVQALSSAQNLHDLEEDQVFAWVQSNSGNVQDVSDNTDATTWVQANSNTIENVVNWSGFEDLNIDQVNETITWYQENSARAIETSLWVEMLTEANNLNDVRETEVFAWVEANSGNISIPIDSQSDTWVEANSSALADVKDWFVQGLDSINDAVTLVNETSALAAKTSQWVQVLSSAHNLHEEEESQVFAWVQSNSDNVQDVSDSTDAVTWVQENSNTLYSVEQWSNSNVVTDSIEWVNTNNVNVNNAVTWFQENSTQASEAVQWIEMLSEAQNIHDEREESVITWVEENSGNLTGTDTTANVWVQANSSDVEDVLNWDGFTELNADRINPAVVWVNETSALATKAAEWVQILSSALDNHDAREEQVLTWVETSSGINMSNSVVNTWVQGHSSKLIQVEAWYNENHPETGDLNNVVDWYGTYGARAAEATEWVEMLAEAQNNHEPRETAVFTWVEANSGNVDGVTQVVNTWVKQNSSAVDTVVEFVESNHDALTSLENWYTTRIVDEVATASAVSWVQHFSARTAAASLWIETISSIEEGHEQFETQIHTWVSENSGLKTKVGSLNAWVTGTSGFTQQVDNWVALNSADIGSFVVWWKWLLNLDNQGHIELEEQVHTWVTLNSARYDATDTWVRDHSSGLIQAETWVECTTAFFRSLSSWAVSSSANYDATYTWVSGTSARVLSAVIWVEQYKEPLEGLYNFYHEKEDIITDIIFWYNTRHVIDDDAGDFVQEHKDAILDNIIWVNEHRVEIENTITWANTSSAKYERAYTWVRDHSTQVQEDHNILIDLQEEVANLYQWVYVYPGPWLINAATTVSANSGNGGVDWSIDTVGQGGGSDCECVWDKVEPITNPLGMLTYNEVLTGKTLKWILEQILYTQDLRITINPSSSTVCPDTTVTFYVSAGPEGPVQYAWYKNDVYIGGSGGTTTNGNVYSIQSAGLSDVGEYYAIATYGTKSLTSLHATVSLKELLTFTEHPIDTTLNTGQTLRLSAEIEGTAPINFVWLKNGLPIAGATNTQYYTRINAATGDSGTYKVSASNACGSAISQEAIVNVYAPVVITLNPVTLTTVNSNSPVTLNAAATGSLPITYKWLSGSNAQSITDEIVGVSTPTYTAQNSGVYVMVACNMVNCATSTPATIAYNIPPSVTILPSITSVRTGTSLTISAIEITGSPTPTLQWYKNNILIGNATSSKYDINSIQTGDEAIYTLSASNIAGTASDTSVVYVWSLQIARDPIGTAINPGATWTMYSSAIGTAPIVYYWAKDGVKITDTDRTSYEASQGGTYVLVASNAFGVLSSDPAIITVNIAPMISLVPETTSVLTNTQLKFDGTLIQGTETVTYKWLKDDVVIPGITTIDYTKSGLTVGDSGTYTLCATNMVGSASAQSILVVNEGLQWKTHPLSATINQGSSHTMTVSAYGTEPITYSWLSGSNTGNITTVISPAAENNRSLTTTASGYYRSIASNLVGSITSNSAQVLFNIAPRITLTPASTSVLTNTQLKFDGTLIEGTPTITYKWLKNGVEIVGAPNSEDYTKTGLLTADSGTYMLCATNMVGSATAESILVVNQALSIVRDPIGTAINPGATWVMYSSAFGTEPIVYYWARNGVRITDTNYTSYEASQAGTYVLVASNLVGTVSSTPAIITVNIAPMISLVPETTSVLTNTQLKFDGTLIQGTETVTYKWLKDDVVIPGITTIDYTKSGLTVGDSGTYTLCATNMVGSASAQSILVVNQALGWITQPAGSAINPGQSYTMFASASGTEPITYRWLSGSNTSNITTQIGTNPTFATTASGYYKVVANNTVVGSITSTNALVTFNTLQISLNPVSQTIETGATVTFTASAIGTPTITYKWHFNGNVITNATGTTLTLTNVQAVSAGSYVLEASNIVGSVSSTIATLTVNAAPTTPTMYWGKFAATTNAGGYFTSLAPGTPLGLSANSPVLTNINNYYVLTANDPNYPQGKYASGLIAANSYTNFSALGRVISADYFDKAFMCNTLSSREILLFQQEDSITFPQSFATSYSAYEIATGLNVSTLFENITLNADMWVFTPANTPGTKWARAYDVGSQANQTFSVPGCACNFLINGSIVPYYAFKLGTASTSKTYNLLMS